MPRDESGVKWAGWPLAGALGAGRHDELAPSPDSFGLTPSAQDEQDRAIRNDAGSREPTPPDLPDADLMAEN